jgi:microcystin-dependent protein
MNNYNFTQSLDGLNNIESNNINTENLSVNTLNVNNGTITTLSNSNLISCTTTSIASVDNDLVNKKYVVDNFVDLLNIQNISGIKTLLSSLYLNAGSRYYSGTNYTEFLQTGTQLTIKPVSINGSLALFSSAPSTGAQTQQLLINNSGVTTTTLNSTTIFCGNYNTTTATGTTSFAFNTTSGIIGIGANISTGSINLGTATAYVNVYGTMTFYANPTSNFSTINQTSNNLFIINPNTSGTIFLRTRPSIGAVQDSLTLNSTSCDILSPTLNLTSTSNINILSPNNLTGNINLFNTLTSGTLNISASGSTTNLNGIINVNGTLNVNGDITSSYNLNFYDTANPLKYTKLSMYSNNFDISILKTGGSAVDTTMTFNINLAGGSSQQILKLESNLATIAGNLYFSNSATTIIDSITTTGVNLFQSISNGTVSLFQSLANNSVATMFSDVASNVNLYINARVRFRNTKFYNQVKTTTGGTLSFPLEENILINSSTNASITLPEINSTTQLGMTFNFIKNSITAQITFNRQGTNTIMFNNSVSGVSSAILLDNGQTTTQLTCLEVVSGSGVYNWVVITSSLPQTISSSIPTASIIMLSVSGTTPTDCYLCDGSSYSIGGQSQRLFNVIGYTYGGASGSTFKVPDFRGMFLRGYGTNFTYSTYASSSIASLQSDTIKSHSHDFTFRVPTNVGAGSSSRACEVATSGYATTISTQTNSSDAETRPASYPIVYFIKN